MRSIGGFFALEKVAGNYAYHEESRGLTSGRACLRRLLATLQPARAIVPFYICNTVLLSFERAQIPIEFYDLDRNLQPKLSERGVSGEVILFVNYFGLLSQCIAEMVDSRNEYIIVDNTQAFFERGHHDAWSFNSARKWFGVPDGAFIYGAGLNLQDASRSASPTACHLLEVDRQVAYKKFKRFEAAVSDQFLAMSPLSAKVLKQVDYDYVKRTRISNYRFLHKELGLFNRLPPEIIERGQSGSITPFCYPLLVDCDVPWDEFWSDGIFVPRLWAEVANRSEAVAYPNSVRIATRLLALPIDHRYGEADMVWLTDGVKRIMRL